MRYDVIEEALMTAVREIMAGGHTHDNGIMGFVLSDLERIIDIIKARSQDPDRSEPVQRIIRLRAYLSSPVNIGRLMNESPARVKVQSNGDTKDGPRIVKVTRLKEDEGGIHITGDLPDKIPDDALLVRLSKLALIQLCQCFGVPCEDTDSMMLLRVKLRQKRGRK